MEAHEILKIVGAGLLVVAGLTPLFQLAGWTDLGTIQDKLVKKKVGAGEALRMAKEKRNRLLWGLVAILIVGSVVTIAGHVTEALAPEPVEDMKPTSRGTEAEVSPHAGSILARERGDAGSPGRGGVDVAA